MNALPEAAISLDVEWACAEVIADVTRLIDERGLRATFFCTHGGIAVPGHERALHPNFDRAGNTQVCASAFPGDAEFRTAVIRSLHSSYPEASGARAHRCHCSYEVLRAYREQGLQYDSATVLPLTPGLRPAWTMERLVWLPVYYMDHWDLASRATGFHVTDLKLDAPGLKIFSFHPNLIYLNAATVDQYEGSRAFYHDAERLRGLRHAGRGTRTLFVELLDWIARKQRARTLTEIQQEWRSGCGGIESDPVDKHAPTHADQMDLSVASGHEPEHKRES